MPLKRKNFLKMYADTMSNVTGDGVWSGRGIAIPHAGAMFGGDDYKEKIGREKIPWYLSDFRGGPSMAADSGWSGISMSRVNKGYDDIHDPKRMFPNQDMQERDEDNIYISSIERMLGGERVSEIKEYFDEDFIVLNSKYSLANVDSNLSEDAYGSLGEFIPDFVKDAEWRDFVPDALEPAAEEVGEYVSDLLDRARDAGRPAYDLLSDKVDQLTNTENSFEKIKDIASEIGRDFFALTAAGIPIIGTPIALAYVIFNLEELQEGQAQALEATDRLMVEGSPQSIVELQKVSGEMFDDYVDLLQAAVYLIPFVGASRGILGAAGKLVRGTRVHTAASFMGLRGSSVLQSAIKSEIILNPVFKFITAVTSSDSYEGEIDNFGIDKVYFHNVLIETAGTLLATADFTEEATRQYKEWIDAGSVGQFKFDPSLIDVSEASISSAGIRLSQNNYEEIRGTVIQDKIQQVINFLDSAGEFVEDRIFAEKKDMKDDLDLLRSFIREAIIYSAEEGSIPNPTGYRYRQPPSSGEDDEESGSMGSGKDVVNYKSDMGYVSYQSRPENLKEQALRRIIRRKLRIAESKKKA